VHFGLFVEEMRQGASQTSAFRDVFELAERADALGIDCVWLGEIHFTPTRSVISSSLQVASAIASRTRRLRVGTAVQVLPLNHPLRIAEEVATVDHISEGRFEFGIGRSGVVRTYDIYGVPYGESQARFREALEIIRQGWKGEPFSYEGEFYRVDNAIVTPRPYQVPHPPIRMATTSDETFPAAGRMGLPIFVGLRTTEIPDLQAQLAPYRQAWHDAGHPGQPSVYLRIGHENRAPALHSLSIVAANYGIANRNLGAVSVVGPVRMDYAQAIGSVRQAAAQLSRFVGELYDE